MINVALALGGNLGNVPETFSATVKRLEQNWLYNVVVSSLYSNPAVNCLPGTPDFINCVMIGKWNKTPEELISLTQKIEIALGRPKAHERNTSRTLDIDIILFGEMTIFTGKLTIPHPLAKERVFVLVPLNEIAPDWIFPDTGKTVNAILKELLSREPTNQLRKIN